MLEVKGLQAGYGKRIILRDLSFEVGEGQVVALLGANGVGKSTLLNTLAGLNRAQSGSIKLDGDELGNVPTYRRVHRGLVLVPDGQQSFPGMTVEENLVIGLTPLKQPNLADSLAQSYEMFPRLAERRSQSAGTLSGGERQMLAIARAMLSQPKVLMLDEPSHGLAPIIVDQIAEIIREVAKTTPTLLVEQNLSIPQHCATHVLVLDEGRITARGTPEELLFSEEVVSAYLGM